MGVLSKTISHTLAMRFLARNRAKTLTVFLVLLALALAPKSIEPAHAATGELYTNPVDITAQAAGTTFSVDLKVVNIASFNAWDVMVASDPKVINATTLSVSGNIFEKNFTGGIPFEIVNCINDGAGIQPGQPGNKGCDPARDAPGIAHSAYGNTKLASGNGLLFTVTFQVVSNRPYSAITIENDLISSGTGQNVPHTTKGSTYGTQAAPDFNIAVDSSSLVVVLGSSNSSTVTLTSLQGLAGTVMLTTTLPGTANGLMVSLNPDHITLSAGGTGTSKLTVQAADTLQASSYSISLTGTFGTTAHSTRVTVEVHTRPDFIIGASPAELLTHQASGTSTIVTVKSVNGFSGPVDLVVQGPRGTTSNFNQTTLTVPLGGAANATLSITLPYSLTRFKDYFNITGTSGSLSHSLQVVAEPPPGDFSISVNPGFTALQAGETKEIAIRITSLDYYIGTIYFLGTSQSGLTFSFEPASFYLNFSRTMDLTLKIASDTTTSAGNHTIVLTAVGQFTGDTKQHLTQVMLAVSAAPIAPHLVAGQRLFLGLQAPVFFGLIGIGFLGLSILGIRELRHPRTADSRPLLE